MADVRVVIERVEAVRMSERVNEDTPATYSVNVSLAEKERNPASLTLNFNLELFGQPQVAKITVTGTATAVGSRDEVQALLKPMEEKGPPPILTTVYERIYGMLYVLSRDLKVPHPMPGLLKVTPSETKK